MKYILLIKQIQPKIKRKITKKYFVYEHAMINYILTIHTGALTDVEKSDQNWTHTRESQQMKSAA